MDNRETPEIPPEAGHRPANERPVHPDAGKEIGTASGDNPGEENDPDNAKGDGADGDARIVHSGSPL
ncbi:hypothetical protein [Sphingomonas sp. LM7]|uniref:hypothetical protein n=1 Tax=Sphingomonas sp. LM7 TaxID=1938607 RepID=UPI0009839A4A|nr:hypothetical protein [Sphingomonas sp. LM7]AQR74521.1 hypothetical protein BXU08_13430 [Sphingomonas sp. LM7]